MRAASQIRNPIAQFPARHSITVEIFLAAVCHSNTKNHTSDIKLQFISALVRRCRLTHKYSTSVSIGGTPWRSWLRQCATSRKVAGSIPDGFIGIFYWHNRSGRTIALGLTQPLTEISTRNISWGQRRPMSKADNLTTFICRLSLNLLELSWPAQACNGIAFYQHRALCHYVQWQLVKPRVYIATQESVSHTATQSHISLSNIHIHTPTIKNIN